MTGRPQAIRPRALSPGSRVALVSPAGPVKPERIARSADRCRAMGLEPVVYPSAGAKHGFLAGTDSERIADLQAAFDDRSIDCVWALRGGYGTLRILDRVDLGRQLEDPIPFIGFSDITTIHLRHQEMDVVAFHGPHPAGDFPVSTEGWFRTVLFEETPPGRFPVPDGGPGPRTLVPGRVEAPLWGGNLSLMAAMCGGRGELSARGRILVLEDVGEAPYRVDRMLTQLRRAGVLEGVAGLALGRFSGGKEDDDPDVEAVLADFAGELGVPALTGLAFGHVPDNYLLPLGVMAELDGDAGTLTLLEPAVRSA